MKRPLLRAGMVTAAALLLVACGKKNEVATQAAARVNGTEITALQIGYLRKQDRNVRADQAEEANRRALERLIDLELLVQKAESLKLDKELKTQVALDAARRDVLARAYVDQVAESVPLPTADDIRKYYDENPALFAKRRVYTLQEVAMQIPSDRVPELQAQVAAGKSAKDVMAWLTAQGIPNKSQAAVRPAEQLPLATLPEFARLPDGHGMVFSEKGQTVATFITSAADEPITLERAKPAITQFLAREARRKALENNFSALRTAGKVEFFGRFAGLAASAPALSTTRDANFKVAAPDTGSTRITLPASGASGVTVSVPVAPASGVQVSLPGATATPGVQVSLPTAAASGVRISLPQAASRGTP